MKDLAGNTALVTGGARRLGRAIAEGLARAGADVVVHYNTSRSEAERVVAGLSCLGSRAWAVQADLLRPGGAGVCFGAATREAGPIDLLINNASMFEPSGLLDFSDADWERNVRLHAHTPLLLARALAAQHRPGCIVNLLDTRITGTDPAHAAYGLSKRMLALLTRDLAVELAPAVRVNGVAPGLVLAPEGHDASYLEARAGNIPLQRHGATDDVVAACLYLVRSHFVTGQVIFVDGGEHLKGAGYASP